MHRTPVSATNRVADRRADLAHSVVADSSDRSGERCLSDRVKTIAVDGGRPSQSDLHMVDLNLCGKTPDRSGYLRHRNEIPNVEHFGSREQQNGSSLATDLSQPNLAASHGSPHASASVQKVPPRSGCFRYASRSERVNAARTASATPWRAAAETLTPSWRARSANSSSSVKVVLDEPITICYQIVIVAGAGRRSRRGAASLIRPIPGMTAASSRFTCQASSKTDSYGPNGHAVARRACGPPPRPPTSLVNVGRSAEPISRRVQWRAIDDDEISIWSSSGYSSASDDDVEVRPPEWVRGRCFRSLARSPSGCSPWRRRSR